ncbi:response regulator transcription factor [Hymenobacter sp. ASUV-10]|uniref:Response regulator transcription factor n=1 Tax=Hymenobacter aranciens TaxID=3063996 RepID=A0ABT9BH20_9BACT|nr:response regulator transcription factor [Hymenobacter sp. ASUV-10]MDO7877565.1 response regulator transcription factor [Hymenobacter sp. ASUV-10]
MNPPYRLALVEDDPTVRELLHGYLCRQPEFDCVCVADSAEALLAWLPDAVLPPQLILLDIHLPGLSGIEALPRLRQLAPEAEVVMQTVFEDTDNIFEALRRGASGYLLKSTPLPQLKAGLLDVAQGGAPMSRTVARKVLGHFKPSPVTQPALLTERERDVVQGLVEGLSEKLVAARLGVGLSTIHSHVKSVYRKLQVNSRSELLSRVR